MAICSEEFILQSILALKKEQVGIAYPSHGEPITEIHSDIETFGSRLEALANMGKLFTSGRISHFDDKLNLRESRLRPAAYYGASAVGWALHLLKLLYCSE